MKLQYNFEVSRIFKIIYPDYDDIGVENCTTTYKVLRKSSNGLIVSILDNNSLKCIVKSIEISYRTLNDSNNSLEFLN